MEQTIVKIGETSHTIPFPNVSQIMQIESLRMSLSSGKYGEMVEAATKSSMSNLDLVDTIATFTVMIPSLAKQLGKTSIGTMEMRESIQLIVAYKKQYLPWFNGINDAIKEDLDKLMADEEKIAEDS